ncbi:hypothetical protein BBK82_45645 [Lentzea guizhouensis]|uniref:Nephrocystin 3-like N-terminal domain-containing protein n=1 Tax=Lentzea guizhouensis TaxID=1586287 RepID=A0A1B2HWP2_9PSEU|nr:hypothetical protein [Lentzea guizhouensis]ANZ42144.1 hypothetical protein BBK82_45645 [Lentzea guizhouensis]
MPEPEVRNESSGDAHIVIQARDIHGDINLVTGTPVRTRYREQVRRIAPPSLLDRSAELAELAAFCATGSSTYSWWRAPAWSGKSALMSTFVLNAPPGVRVVSFFVTARWSSQNDRAAFIDNVTEQLLALLGESLPPLLTESTRETHLLGLLEDTATACQSRGERLVLLVDGLDEDRGVHPGPDSHSIAALLPASPPAGLRVVVAGRPNPPIPADVPQDHPLRDPAIIRSLAPSPAAQAIRVEMERELKNLLHASPAEQDLLGLVAVAGGGLSAADLTSLTGLSPYQVADSLRTVTGRSFSERDGHFQPGRVYVLGHEELQATALEMLGQARLTGYRNRLHAWADEHRAQGWPATTPEYLLRGYYALLSANDDITRMVSCATDPARHERLLAAAGGDAAALAEITTAFDVIASNAHPDLTTLARLAVHRDHLTERNRGIPAGLPAVWAVLGHVNRAEAVARSIQDPGTRIAALAAVATAVAEAGDHDRADALLDQAVDVHHAGNQSAWASAALVDALADRGDLRRAEPIARSIRDPRFHATALVRVAALAGDRTAELVVLAEADAFAVFDAHERDGMLTSVATAAAHIGQLSRAEAVARNVSHSYRQMLTLLTVATAAAEAGETALAETIVRGIPRSVLRMGPLTPQFLDLVTAIARGDNDLGRATGIVRSFLHSSEQIPALVSAVAATGDIDRAERIAATGTDPEERNRALAALIRPVAVAGDLDRAERIADTITEPELRRRTVVTAVALAGHADLDDVEAALDGTLEPVHLTRVLATVARTAAQLGRATLADEFLDRAETSALTVAAEQRAEAFARVAHAAAFTGDPIRATTLLDRAESMARSIIRPGEHLGALLASTAGAATRAGDLDRATAVARTIGRRSTRVQALTAIAEKAAEKGDLDRAVDITSLLDRLRGRALPKTLLHLLHYGLAEIRFHLDERAKALHAVVTAAARAGALSDAETIARTLGDTSAENWLLLTITEIAARNRKVDSAEVIARLMSGRGLQRVWALALAASAAASNGDRTRAGILFDHAESTIRDMHDSDAKLSMTAKVAELAAGCGDVHRAQRIADQIAPITAIMTSASPIELADHGLAGSVLANAGHRYPSARVMAALAKAAAGAGDIDRAAWYLDRAKRIAATAPDPLERVFAQAWTAATAAEIGDLPSANALLDRAEGGARSLAGPGDQEQALWAVAEVVSDRGDLDRAEGVLGKIIDPNRRARALLRFAADPARRRASTVAKALQLGHWTQAAELLTEMEPDALAALTEELEKIRAAGSRTA